MAEFLLLSGVDINEDPGINHGRTELQAAAGEGHLQMVKILIESYDADVNKEAGSHYGRTALQAAAGGGHLQVVKFLLEKGADIDGEIGFRYGRTALQAAAECGSLDIIQLLLDNGANASEPVDDESGITPFQAAALGPHLDAMELLLSQRGVNVNQAFGKEWALLHPSLREMKDEPWSPLELAVITGDRAMVKLLVDHQARVSKKILTRAHDKPFILKILRKAMLKARSAAKSEFFSSHRVSLSLLCLVTQ